MDEQAQWYHQTMQEFDPAGYQEMLQHEQRQQQAEPTIEEAIQYANQAVKQGVDIPFKEAPQAQQKESFEAQANQEAVPNQEASVQNFEAVQYGAPIEEKKEESKEEKKETKPTEKKVEEEIKVDNPWNTPEVMQAIQLFKEHKQRLNINKDNELLPHIRDYFQDEKASLSYITPQNLPDFNLYLTNIQA